jgi:hypothetical protein
MRYSLLLVILVISVSSSVAQIELDPVWINRYAKTPGNQPHEIPAGLGVDNNGNVYVTMSEAVDEWLQWITVSYKSDSSFRWDATVSSEHGFCEPAGLAVEENGSNVYVTGYRRLGENGKDDFLTVNYNGSSGGAVWETIFGLEDHDRAKAITIDDDYVYVTGYIDSLLGGSGQDHAFCTIKYSKSGVRQWYSIYNMHINDDEACAIAVHNGNVYVTGRSWNNLNMYSRWDFLTIKYNSNGDSVWTRSYNVANEDDVPKAIAVDENENVYITGYSESLSSINSDFYTISYNSNGGMRWRQRYNGTDNHEDSANAIALDKTGHVYVTGSCQGKDSLDNFLTIKYDTNGVRDTIGVYDHDGLRDEAISIAVEDSGKYIYVTGEVKEDDDDGSYYTIVYDSDFNIIDYDQYDGPGNVTSTEDYANNIVIDDDYIYVTGASMGADFDDDNFDCVTIKYAKYQDVGCSTIVAPIGTVDSGTVVTPACSVYNYGDNYPTYPVRMKIGNPSNPLYNKTVIDTASPSNRSKYVEFESTYANWPRGKHPVRCSTEYANDMNKSNDRKTDSIIVRVKDVGCSKIIVPIGTIDSGTVVTPACSVYNYGTTTESYDVRMKIGNYSRTASITSHLSSSLKYVTFPVCTLFQRGYNTVSCSTELATDANKPNDKKTGSVLVGVHDVGCTKIIDPSGTIDSGNVVVAPACSVYNYGTTPESYRVRMKIGDFYNETTYVSNHTPGTLRYITFPGWVVWQRGNHIVKCSTELATDVYKTNDLKIDSVFVKVIDIGCSKIEAPSGTIDSGTVVTPACSVYNYGNVCPPLMPFSARMKIGRFWDQTTNIMQTLNPGTAIYITFRDWVATQIGTHTVTCSTQLSYDMNKPNDKKTGSVTVQRSKDGGVNNEVTAIAIDSAGVKVQKPDEDNSKKIDQTTESNDSGTVVTPIYQAHNQGNMGSTIQIKTGINSVAILRIYNVLGKLLHSEKTNDGYLTIDGLPTGIYILRLQTKNRTEIRKLLIVK